MNLKKTVITMMALAILCYSAWAQEQWQEYRTRHFAIYYKEGDLALIRNIEEWAERFYGEIIRDLGFTRYFPNSASNQISIYIYRDQEDYLQSGRQEKWSHGVTYFRHRQIRTFPAAHGFFDTVLPHELGHLIFRDMIGQNSTVPLWLDEGVAMFQEKAKRWGAHKIVKRAISAGTYIPLDKLSQFPLNAATSRENIELFYAESASLVYYMIQELGEHRFVRMCVFLKEGESFSAALTKAYGRFRGPADLERGWLDYLQSQ